MKPKVYVETSVISYLAARSSHDAATAGRQLITERWWSSRKSEYDLLISEAVEDLYASRDAYAEEHGNDLDRIFADLTRREKTSEVRRFREPE